VDELSAVDFLLGADSPNRKEKNKKTIDKL
jgi:hypothetical protein